MKPSGKGFFSEDTWQLDRLTVKAPLRRLYEYVYTRLVTIFLTAVRQGRQSFIWHRHHQYVCTWSRRGGQNSAADNCSASINLVQIPAMPVRCISIIGHPLASY